MNKAIRNVMCSALFAALFVALIIVVCVHSARAGLPAGSAGPAAGRQGSRKDDVVFNAQGHPMAGATVRVCTSTATGQPCSPLALIYSDAALTQALANPLSTDGLGNYMFYASPGRYMIELSGPGITTKQLPNVILPSDPSSPTFTTVTTTSGISAFSLTLAGNLTVNGSTAVVGTLTVGGAPVPSTNQDNQWAAAQRFKGPIPWRDVTAYGASGSPQGTTTSGTFAAGTFTLPLTSSVDFQNGQSLRFPVNIIGDISITTAPSGLVVAQVGAAGSTHYQYQVACVDRKWGESAANTVVAITNGAASLMYSSGFANANYNHVTWSAATGCTYYAVYGRTSGSMALLGITPNLRWEDYGQANMSTPSSLSAAPPATAQRGYYYGKIVSGGGTTTLTMDTAPGISIGAGGQIVHDDSAAIQAAIDAAAVALPSPLTAGTQDRIYFPPGSYNVSQPLISNVNSKMRFEGAAENAVYLLPGSSGMDLFLIEADGDGITWQAMTVLAGADNTVIHYADAAIESLYVNIDQIRASGSATSTFFRTDVNTIIENWTRFQVGAGVNYRYGEPAMPVQMDDIHFADAIFTTGSDCTTVGGTFQSVNNGGTGGMFWRNILLEGPGPSGCSPAIPWFRMSGNSGIVLTTFQNVEFAPENNSATTGPTFTAWPGTIPTGSVTFIDSPIGSIGTGGLFDFATMTGFAPRINLIRSPAFAAGGAQVWKTTGDLRAGLTCNESAISPTQTLVNTNGHVDLRDCSGYGVAGVSLDRIDYEVSTTTNLLERNDSVGNNIFVVENSGAIKGAEAAAPSGAAGFDKLYADSTAHRFKMNNNNGTAMAVSGIVASGTAALGTSSIASGACAAAVTVSATGVLTTDTITYTPNADISGVTGYGSVNGPLTIYPYPTADNINFKVCNWTAISYTPGAVTLNWKVIR